MNIWAFENSDLELLPNKETLFKNSPRLASKKNICDRCDIEIIPPLIFAALMFVGVILDFSSELY